MALLSLPQHHSNGRGPHASPPSPRSRGGLVARPSPLDTRRVVRPTTTLGLPGHPVESGSQHLLGLALLKRNATLKDPLGSGSRQYGCSHKSGSHRTTPEPNCAQYCYRSKNDALLSSGSMKIPRNGPNALQEDQRSVPTCTRTLPPQRRLQTYPARSGRSGLHPEKGSGKTPPSLAAPLCRNSSPTIHGLVQSLHLPIASLSPQGGVVVSWPSRSLGQRRRGDQIIQPPLKGGRRGYS
ncbi:hypothetical protein OUZ56_014224 [Daphnia magna]|uniref:Uncharacterized protein n=1 Tax=Daphnia magna TaxID=35525 RepID=A0ABQ9Z869_9CRUS|nr:hypothetical protein OUZ56_014224 [Daphnia magna]